MVTRARKPPEMVINSISGKKKRSQRNTWDAFDRRRPHFTLEILYHTTNKYVQVSRVKRTGGSLQSVQCLKSRKLVVEGSWWPPPETMYHSLSLTSLLSQI